MFVFIVAKEVNKWICWCYLEKLPVEKMVVWVVSFVHNGRITLTDNGNIAPTEQESAHVFEQFFFQYSN